MNKPIGTFLVRNSSIKGHYVVSYVNDLGQVSHKLIVNLGIYKGSVSSCFFIDKFDKRSST